MNMYAIHNRTTLKKLLVCICMALSMVHYSAVTSASSEELRTQNRFCLHDHYKKVCDSIINIWSILDIMRSINIESKARVDFVHHQLFGAVIMAMRETIALEVGFRIYGTYDEQQSDELQYLFDMIDHVENAFEAVFTPSMSGEEKLLAVLMIELFEGVKNIRQLF